MKEPLTTRDDLPAAGGPGYRGWRLSLNRFIWRAHIFIAGSLVVWVERVCPNRGYGQRLFSASARLTNRLLGVRVEVIGRDKLDPDQTYVFTPDHRSHLDITALMAALPTARYAAKRELFAEPVLGPAMRALGMIPTLANFGPLRPSKGTPRDAAPREVEEFSFLRARLLPNAI